MGRIEAGAQVDPVGPVGGYTKVVRGGGLDFRHAKPGQVVPAESPYFSRAANRASMAPAYAAVDGNIGFRVVQAPMPATKPDARAEDVLRDGGEADGGPDYGWAGCGEAVVSRA